MMQRWYLLPILSFSFAAHNTNDMKVLIPVAGVGTRLRPHTFTQPKPLMPVAGKPIICFIMDKMVEVGVTEFVFVIGYLGVKVRNFIEEQYPNLKTTFVYQENREGSAHAVWSARNEIKDDKELIIAFGDTIFDGDLKLMLAAPNSCIGVKKVDDPREFGVAELHEGSQFISKLIEKPKIPKSNLALVGLYKINDVPLLIECCERNIKAEHRTVGEFQLTDALDQMISQGHQFMPIPVTNWYDCGRKDVLLQTNAMLLNQDKLTDSLNLPVFENTIIVHPVAIGEGCEIKNSIIGPNVTIGNHARVSHSVVQDSIIGNFASLEEIVLKRSVIGSDAIIKGFNLNLNIGDHTEIDFQ
jgi:glucose-1-phosphate thymidylyltransferase